MVSKYCWVCRSGAAGSVSVSAKVTPCIGSWSIPSTDDGDGDARDVEDGGRYVDDVRELRAEPPGGGDPLRPVDDHGVPRAAQVRAHLLAPLERGVAGPRPRCAVVRIHELAAPGFDAAVALGELELHLVGERDAVLHGQLVERAGDRAFHARAVVAPDPDDQGVAELTEFLDGVDHPADVVVGVFGEARIHLHLTGVEGLQVRGTSSHAGNASFLGVSSASAGITPSAFCRAKVSSRSLSQPWSNLPLYLSAQAFAT